MPRDPRASEAGTGDCAPPAPLPVARRATGSWDPDSWDITRLSAACPHCQTRREPADQFCLGCRYDFANARLPQPAIVRPVEGMGTIPRYPAAPEWDAVIEVDARYFGSLAGDGLRLPAGREPKVIPLGGVIVPIGARRDGSPQAINLVDALHDPAVSGRHARLDRQPDGSYAIIDRQSLNGTRVNDTARPIRPGQAVLLHDGDRVFLGAWTRITFRHRPGKPAG
ncbi:FHA domain-containing protein [Frankia sp. EI5c]|uniref:FHA domain-containing protein n=1 Tax=Frankia sp. EI5c TaxID=683316 RepID=UPI0007C229C0|nr:FHA domain-containing protein [Frankia sp. EI5c]OAA23990.1 FHA domain-containing protein [Frankia sp. EI5c]